MWRMTAGPTSQMPWGGGWGAGGSRTGKTEATPTSATLHLRRAQRQGTKESDNDTEPLWASFFWYHLRSSNLPIWQMCAVVICYYMFNPFSASKFFWGCCLHLHDYSNACCWHFATFGTLVRMAGTRPGTVRCNHPPAAAALECKHVFKKTSSSLKMLLTRRNMLQPLCFRFQRSGPWRPGMDLAALLNGRAGRGGKPCRKRPASAAPAKGQLKKQPAAAMGARNPSPPNDDLEVVLFLVQKGLVQVQIFYPSIAWDVNENWFGQVTLHHVVDESATLSMLLRPSFPPYPLPRTAPQLSFRSSIHTYSHLFFIIEHVGCLFYFLISVYYPFPAHILPNH